MLNRKTLKEFIDMVDRKTLREKETHTEETLKTLLINKGLIDLGFEDIRFDLSSFYGAYEDGSHSMSLVLICSAQNIYDNKEYEATVHLNMLEFEGSKTLMKLSERLYRSFTRISGIVDWAVSVKD